MGQLSGRMEVFGARPGTPLEESLAEVDASDLLVGIYAHRYGTTPDGVVSITEREYDRAVELGKLVLAFIVDDAFAWDDRFKEPSRAGVDSPHSKREYAANAPRSRSRRPRILGSGSRHPWRTSSWPQKPGESRRPRMMLR
jgi:hypothetical protein